MSRAGWNNSYKTEKPKKSYGHTKMDLEEQKKEIKHIENLKRFYSITNPQDAFQLTSENFDGSFLELFNYTTDKTDCFQTIAMNRRFLSTNVNTLAKRDFLAHLNTAKNQYFRENLGFTPDMSEKRVGLTGGSSQFNPRIICSKSKGSFQEVQRNFNMTANILRDKKKSNFVREAKLNKPTQPGTEQNQEVMGFQSGGGGSTLFKRDNNSSQFQSSGSIFTKSYQPTSSMADDNPFKARDKPTSLFKTESSLFPSKSSTSGNSLFPSRKEGTNSIFQKTGSTYGSESPKKFTSSSLFPSKDNNNPFSTSTATSGWGKSGTSQTSIFQSKPTTMSPNRGSTLFQSSYKSGNVFEKKESTLFQSDKTVAPYTRSYSITQGPPPPVPETQSEPHDQKEKDAFHLLTNLIRNPFSREKNKEMLHQFKQSYEKSQAIKQKEIEQILKNPYQLPKHAVTLSARTAVAPTSQPTRTFPTSYLSDTGYKRKRYESESFYQPQKEKSDSKVEYNFSTLLQDLEEYRKEDEPEEIEVPCNSISEHKLPRTQKYMTMPSRQEMMVMSDSDLRSIQDFYVICAFGNIHFLEPVDVRGLDLDKIIIFESDNFQIYPDNKAPVRGKGLNVSFDLTVLLSAQAQALEVEEIQKWAGQVGYENNFEVQKIANDSVVFRRYQ